jgi:hypothetical protein
MNDFELDTRFDPTTMPTQQSNDPFFNGSQVVDMLQIVGGLFANQNGPTPIYSGPNTPINTSFPPMVVAEASNKISLTTVAIGGAVAAAAIGAVIYYKNKK